MPPSTSAALPNLWKGLLDVSRAAKPPA